MGRSPAVQPDSQSDLLDRHAGVCKVWLLPVRPGAVGVQGGGGREEGTPGRGLRAAVSVRRAAPLTRENSLVRSHYCRRWILQVPRPQDSVTGSPSPGSAGRASLSEHLPVTLLTRPPGLVGLAKGVLQPNSNCAGRVRCEPRVLTLQRYRTAWTIPDYLTPGAGSGGGRHLSTLVPLAVSASGSPRPHRHPAALRGVSNAVGLQLRIALVSCDIYRPGEGSLFCCRHLTFTLVYLKQLKVSVGGP